MPNSLRDQPAEVLAGYDRAMRRCKRAGLGAAAMHSYLTWARRPLPLGMGRNGSSPAGEHWLCYTVSSSFAPFQLHAVSAVPQEIVPAGKSLNRVGEMPSDRGVCEELPVHWIKPNYW